MMLRFINHSRLQTPTAALHCNRLRALIHLLVFHHNKYLCVSQSSLNKQICGLARKMPRQRNTNNKDKATVENAPARGRGRPRQSARRAAGSGEIETVSHSTQKAKGKNAIF